MAILHYRFRSRSDFSININRIGALGVALALIYLNLSKMGGSSNSNGGGNSGDPLGDILNDY